MKEERDSTAVSSSPLEDISKEAMEAECTVLFEEMQNSNYCLVKQGGECVINMQLQCAVD